MVLMATGGVLGTEGGYERLCEVSLVLPERY